MVGCRPGDRPPPARLAAIGAAHGWTEAALGQGFDFATLALARRHDPDRARADLWGRPTGWANLDIAAVPDLGLAAVTPQTAREINDLRPLAKAPIRPMRKFMLHAGAADARQAQLCLSQAVYYEAAREPLSGRQAVAQVVLNRLRHPAYPKSICGVVFQGSARATGCQFSFTCDGALRWAPEPKLWAQAQDVARRALSGFVAKDVGSATHYHADYVAPYWATTLVKMNKIGAHIFYRWTGPWGEPPAFTGRYAGDEGHLSPAVLGGVDPRTNGLFSPENQGVPGGRKVTLAIAGEVRTYTVADPAASGGRKTRVLGTIFAPRRQPTPEEVKEINEKLSIVEKQGEGAAPEPQSIDSLLSQRAP